MMPVINIWRDCYDPIEFHATWIRFFSTMNAVSVELAQGLSGTGRKLLPSLRGERNPALNKHEK